MNTKENTMLMSLTPRVTPAMGRKLAAACGAGVLLFAASACGSDPTPAASGAEAGPQTSQNGPSTRGAGFPGANGKVAAVDGSTAQVQSQGSGQVAVSWTGATAFTKQVSATLADIRTGTCVMVTSTDDGSTAQGSDTSAPSAITAASVRITEAVDGSCTGGLRGGPQGQQGDGGQPPSGSEGGTPPRTQFRGAGGAFGEVTAVSATGFTVTSSRPGAPSSSDSTPDVTETTVTVTVSGTTTYTTTAKGAAADVKVGVCVRAEGKTDTTGAIAATSIAVTPAENGECGGAMVFRQGGSGGSSDSGTGATTQES